MGEKMKNLILYLMITCAGIAGESLGDLLKRHPERLIQNERLSRNDEAWFTMWTKEEIDKEITVKLRWDGGHYGGYAAVIVGKRTFPVHVEFTYTGEIPKKPKHPVKLRTDKCRKTGAKHYKVTRTGKEIEVSGDVIAIKAPLKICRCGKPELFRIKIKARSIK